MNPYLNPLLDEDAFVDRLIGSVPPFPPYYLRMKALNSIGAKQGILDRPVPALNADEFAERVESTEVAIVDLRDQVALSKGFVPGALGIGLGKLLPVWAAWVVPPDRDILLVGSGSADDEQDIAAARTLFARVGLDHVAGYLRGGVAAWIDSGRSVDTLPQISPQQVVAKRNDRTTHLELLDVRSDDEWARGHADGAIHVFGGVIESKLNKLPPPQTPLAVMCGGGYRSTVVASLLKSRGYQNVVNVTGGMAAWSEAGLPTTASG